jgi:hypothetical protein
MPINSTLDVVLQEDDLVVLGPPSTIEISTDIGAKGDRGGTVFNGTGDPNALSLEAFADLYGKSPVYGDIFIRIDYGSSYGKFYSYSTGPGGDQWVPILDLLQTMDLFFQYNDQAEDSFYSFVAASAIHGSASAIPQLRFDQNKRLVDIDDIPVNITTSQISNFNSSVALFLSNAVTSNTENGIGVTYNSASNTLNFDVNDFNITLDGDVEGTATVTNLGNVTISASVMNNSHDHISTNITDFNEAVQDVIGGMVSSNTENGIQVLYDDSTGKLNFDVGDFNIQLTGDVQGLGTVTNLNNVAIVATVNDDSHFHSAATISGLLEGVEDVVGQMVIDNIENGIVVTYADNGTGRGKLNFDVNDFTITYAGDITGSTVITNLGSTTTNLQVVNDSHTHTIATIDNFSEQVQDIAAALLNHGFHTNISASYDDANNRIYLVGQSELGGGGGGGEAGTSLAITWWLGV